MLHNAGFEQQRILKPVVQNNEPVVIVVQDKINVVACLLCSRDILWAAWSEAHKVVCRSKHTHERGHDHFDHVRRFGRNYAGPALDLITQRFPQVIVHCINAVVLQFGIVIIDRLLDLAAHDCVKLCVVHFCHSSYLAIQRVGHQFLTSWCGSARPDPRSHSCGLYLDRQTPPLYFWHPFPSQAIF